jgi:hypothetical protein
MFSSPWQLRTQGVPAWVLYAPPGQASALARMCWWLLGQWLRLLVPPHSHCGPSCSGTLVEFQGTQQAVVEGASRPCVRLWDRWLRLVPEVVLPPPVGGPPGPVPVPVAKQRCTLSIGAWKRCCGSPFDWETDLRLRLPAVAFELRDLHDLVCP